MASSQTFAKKLQAAIKVKIQELGVDADNDMAEYVMVLAANKKDKSHMKKELHLFLGKNTGCFVDWLFAAFERIQKTLTELKKQQQAPKCKADSRFADKATKKLGQDKKLTKSSKDERLSRNKVEKESRSSRHNDLDEYNRSAKSREQVSKREKLERSSSKWKEDRLERPKLKEDKSFNLKTRRDGSKEDRSDKSLKKYEKSSLRHEKLEKSSRHERSKVEVTKKRRHSPKNHVSTKEGNKERSDRIFDSEEDSKLKDDKKDRSDSCLTIKRPRILPPSQSTLQEYVENRHLQRHLSTSTLDSDYHHQPKTNGDDEKVLEKKDMNETSNSRSGDSTPAPLTNAWDGRITIDDDSSDDENAEAQIDALLDGLDELIDTIPETSILSGSSLSFHPIPRQTPSPSQSISEAPVATLSSSTPSNNNNTPIQKIMERCRFWPGCNRGTQCQYHHPTEVCLLFPKCPYGDRCLNIHPLCKFNKKCKKPRCPFTHDLKGVATLVMYPHDVPAAQQQQDQTISETVVTNSTTTLKANFVLPCKFKGRCAVPDCSFMHPPPCRFGLWCSNPVCTFSHRKPNLKKFQWVSGNSDTHAQQQS